MGKSNYAEDQLLDAVWNFDTTGLPSANLYISLHTADPGETGANEAAGGSYARQQADFGAASGGTLSNSANIDFTSMPAATIVAWGAWDAVSAGNCWWTGWLSTQSGLGVHFEEGVTDDVYSPDHTLAADDRVVFEVVEGYTIPTGLTAGTLYWVIATGLTADSFRVSTTQGGAAVNITADGQAIWREVVPKTTNSGDTFRIAAGDLDIFDD